MSKIELEKTTNELRGVAGMLLMMSELPDGDFKVHSWVPVGTRRVTEIRKRRLTPSLLLQSNAFS